MINGEVVLMMQQLSFSPVENILTVLFAAAILGYLLYLLVRSLRNRQRGYHTVNRAKVFSKRQATAVNQPVYLANGTVNSGVTEAENVKTVIFENLEIGGRRCRICLRHRKMCQDQCGNCQCYDSHPLFMIHKPSHPLFSLGSCLAQSLLILLHEEYYGQTC